MRRLLVVLTLVSAVLVAAPEARAHHYAPIQPGAQMVEPAGCTMNYVYEDQFGTTYIGTAGHCVGFREGEEVELADVGLIGEVVWVPSRRTGADFALVEIDPALLDQVSPALRHWGGPTGVLRQEEFLPGIPMVQYGYGIGFGFTEPTRARAGFLELFSETTCHYRADVPAIFGDSGSATMTADGRAVGVVTNLDLWSFHLGTNIACVQRLAREELGLELTVRTAPVAEPLTRERERVRHMTGL